MSPLRRVGTACLILWKLFGALMIVMLGAGVDGLLHDAAWYESLLFIPMLVLGAGLFGVFFAIPPTTSWWLVLLSFGVVEGGRLGLSSLGWPGIVVGAALGGVVGFWVGLVPTALVLMFLPEKYLTFVPSEPTPDPAAAEPPAAAGPAAPP